MNALVGYGSSDEEEEPQQPRPSKIAKTEPVHVPHSNTKNAPALSKHLPQDASVNTASIAQTTIQAGEPGQLESNGPAAGPSIPQPEAANVNDATPFSPYTYERQRLRELTMPAVPNFDIPDSPPPPPRNSEEAVTLAATTKKFERFLELKKQGIHFNERLQNSSSLRNPSLLPKLMDFAGISKEESYASSLPEEVAVPAKWPEECYVESLLRQNGRKEKKRLAERDKLDFVPAAKSAGSSATGTPNGGAGGKRKSRFDKS